MRISPSITISQPLYRGFSVNADQNNPSHSEILDSIQDRFLYMTSAYPSVMVIQVALTFPQSGIYPPSNDYIKQLMNSLCHHLQRYPDCQYIWVLERSQDGGLHYHLCLLVATNWPLAFHVIVGKLKDYWASALNIGSADGLVHYGTEGNGTIMHQDDPDFIQVRAQRLFHASYLAKLHTKGKLPRNLKGFGASQLRSSSVVI